MFHALLPECFDVLCEDICGDGMQDAVPAVLDVGDVGHDFKIIAFVLMEVFFPLLLCKSSF